MGLNITARFVLGAYQGKSPSGQPEAFPGTDRLLAALVAAAGSGPHAVGVGPELKIPDRHRAALRWLEGRAPSHLKLPDTTLNAPDVVAYRRSGLLNRGTYGAGEAKPAVARSFLSGPVVWRWDEQPEAELFDALQELCAEASHLGEAQSLVVIEAALDDEPPREALERVPSDELFPAEAVPVSTPLPGRLDELEGAHEALRTARRAAERTVAKDESEVVAHRPNRRIELVWYRLPRLQGTELVPWDRALVLEVAPVDPSTVWPPPPEEVVAWCVAMHRALVRVLDPDVPPLVSGHYAPGATLPANRLAIQVVGRHQPLGFKLSHGVDAAFALLLPPSATPEDQDAVVRAVHALASTRLYRGRAGSLEVRRIVPVAASSFWRPPVTGLTRWWVTEPLAVAETRPAARPSAGRWTLVDALHLSIGLVHRDVLGLPPAKGNAAFRQVVEKARPQIDVVGIEQVAGPDLPRFVHKTNPGHLATAYRALFRAPGLLSETAPVAIGQSRHLGTGLLVPMDLPQRGSDTWAAPGGEGS
jgi:CRISPR-associated protein Csb2